uniref:Putative family 31 glucosidase KIAA1161 n=1 Tax=Lygus hesperus TaxID=30085 RepID=A0A0A9ZJ17_LYGHE
MGTSLLLGGLISCAFIISEISSHPGVGANPYTFEIYPKRDSATVLTLNSFSGTVTDGSFSVNFGADSGIPMKCNGLRSDEEVACVQWFEDNSATQNLIQISKKDNPGNYPLYRVIASTGDFNDNMTICFSHKGENLYGGNVGNNYPSQKIIKEGAPFVTGEGDGNQPTTWVGWVAEKKWLTSGGRAIQVQPGSPLFISQNATDLCFILNPIPPYSANIYPVQIEFDLCLTNNVKEAWLCQNPDYGKAPLPVDYEYLLREPIWSTWVAYKKDTNQTLVTDFVSSITKYGFRLGVLEIDEKWETCFGSQKFDSVKFPDPKKLIKDVHALGAKITFWRHPFVNKECDEFKTLAHHLFKDRTGATATTTWWEGEGALFNFMQNDTYEFFAKRLRDFKNEYGMDGFKFDAGEAYYIPTLFYLTPFEDPNIYSTTYLKLVESFGPDSEVRVGADSYNFKLLQRLQDTQSDWSLSNFGIKSVIPSTLQLSILGYRTILPDMIGGNVYGPPPDKELFIRWVELNAFLPIMQFSYHPWTFDEETINITRRYIELHYEYSDLMISIRNDPRGIPLINAVWWLDPEDSQAQQILDEFLVGEEILVAPVVEKGATSRSIYIPSGTWKDGNNGNVILGPQTIQQYPAPLDTLPYFLRQTSEK